MPNHKDPLVSISNNERLVTNSLAISQHFGKLHKNVISAIENLECSDEFNRLNFKPITYQDGRQRSKPAYEITRDGFMFLCMGFTGKPAGVWKERYIQAFNQMEKELQRRRNVSQDEHIALKKALLAAKPEHAKLIRYTELGLQPSEIGKLLGISAGAVRHRQIRLEATGLLTRHVNPSLAAAGRKGYQSMLEAKQ